ncbi:MAG TPA: GGDEF domain-containing protein [Gammaproteobacteria bacterium]|nr:GGDEF domain-containing protein [Gammaproteobacteria bacterium]
MTARCRKSDMIARYGGEEFLIFFPEVTAAEANAKCEELRLAIARYDWQSLRLHAPVTISFGIAESRGGMPPRSLMDEADVRLYEAKKGGRNLVVA